MQKIVLIFSFFILIFSSCNIFKNTVEGEYKRYDFNGIYPVVESGMEYQYYNDTGKIWIDTSAVVRFEEFSEVKKKKSNSVQAYELLITMTDEAGERFEVFTKNNINKKAAFILNDKLIMAPVIATVITGNKVSVIAVDEKDIDEVILNHKSYKKSKCQK